jgi:hypothetical protein
MEEWARTLLSTCVGFSAGLLAEPAKFWISNKLKKRQMIRALHAHLAYLYGQFTYADYLYHKNGGRLDEEATYMVTETLQWTSVDIFEHYYNSEKPLYWSMKSSGHVRTLYEAAKRGIGPDIDIGTRLHAVAEFLVLFSRVLDKLRPKLFNKYFRKYYGTRFDAAIADQKRRYSAVRVG